MDRRFVRVDMRFARTGWDTYEFEIPEGASLQSVFDEIYEDASLLYSKYDAEIVATTDDCTDEFEITDIEEVFYGKPD